MHRGRTELQSQRVRPGAGRFAHHVLNLEEKYFKKLFPFSDEKIKEGRRTEASKKKKKTNDERNKNHPCQTELPFLTTEQKGKAAADLPEISTR